ncbi:helix-turn-helix domain-containing protein [Candidatus Berkiella aquae]|uniref:Helix-turn-helix domain-containing protein n=1 Tax=Candidatus Berkiella aquae TaxID=295108 RepID=A0A0Q9YPT1_9GAMM|nr:helix-turn-helix domain-containing protein [Candidatus Berkiella aquae]MCS5709877.1 helix-turn-helix domain-containing protein [Candidatus Berkiella aquae]
MQAYYSFSRIISDARQFTRTAKISLAEVLFVFSHTQLNEIEKILWLFLATHADENFNCQFSYMQLSFCLNLPSETVHVALKYLVAMGFLETEDLIDSFTPLKLMKGCLFSVQLPLEGLLALKKTPKLSTEYPKRKPININLLHNRFNTRS